MSILVRIVLVVLIIMIISVAVPGGPVSVTKTSNGFVFAVGSHEASIPAWLKPAWYSRENRSHRIEREVHTTVNEFRVEHGLAQYAWSPQLAREAESHARDMAEKDYLSHTNQNGVTQGERYPCRSGENLAWLSRGRGSDTGTAEAIVYGWMNSREHREEGVLGSWSRAGVGVEFSDKGEVYVVMGFC